MSSEVSRGTDVSFPLPEQLLGAIVLTSGLLLPIFFVPGLEDAFALPKLTFLTVAFGLSIAALGGAFLASSKLTPPLPPFLRHFLVAFIALNVFALVLSVDPRRSLLGEYRQYQGLLLVIICVAFFYVGFRVSRTPQVLKLLLTVVTLGAVPVCLYGLMQYVSVDPVDWQFGSGRPWRIFSSFGQPNHLAAYLVMVIPIAVGLASNSVRWTRIALVGLVTLMGVVLILTISRAGYLAFLITAPLVFGTLIWQTAGLRRRPRLMGAVTAFVALIVVALIVLVQPLSATAGDAGARFVSLRDLSDKSLQSHYGMWLVAGEISIDRPILGAGQDTYPMLFAKYRDRDLPGFDRDPAARPEDPHNHYLAIAASSGIPSLIVYLAIVLACLVLALRRVGRADKWRATILMALTSAILAHLVTDTFTNGDVTSTWLFWLLMGLTIRVAYGTDESSTDTSPHRRTIGSGRWRPIRGVLYSATAGLMVLFGLTVAASAALPFSAAVLASSANRVAASGDWRTAALQYDQAASRNPFESRYLSWAGDAYFQAARAGDDPLTSLYRALDRYETVNQRFAAEPPTLQSEAKLRAMLLRLGLLPPGVSSEQAPQDSVDQQTTQDAIEGPRVETTHAPVISPPNPLTGFYYPIVGACLPQNDDLLPNAPRFYRAGTHEGVDFNDAACIGVTIGTPVVAAGNGTIIRSDSTFVPMTTEEQDELLIRSHLLGYTDEATLDRLRGRQVWIDHGNGVVTRYAHLGRIAPGIEVGLAVEAQEVIGYVGNSGTLEGVADPGAGPHLHFEIRLNDSYLGAGLAPAQVRALLEQFFARP